ncbi:RING/U-box superfamily protein [Striga hermonthica]|uniref:RBR-type E3 ubiquitin transferase n=1 Tax=Striga hermonthica TaxID=68872 RepID=A0A9N7RRY6_STRHE|nr:RING/U-box superfamily protein [Striga hermonthica]
MAPKSSEIIKLPGGAAAPVAAADDDEISVIYATPLPANNGATKFDAISVEDYRPKLKRRTIGLSRNPYSDDDEVKVLHIFPKSRKKVFLKGECSYPEPEGDTKPVPRSTFMCEICADEKPKEESFPILGCHHSYCADCVRNYVGAKLQDNVVSIKCPVSGCKGSLEPQHCRSILPEQVFNRWGDALCEAVILATEKFYCPFKDCSALLVDERKGKNEVIAESECPNCNRLFCAKCRVPWHSGVTCKEFEGLKKGERTREDIMLMSLAKNKKWMRCPQCSIYVEKITGCFFITCRCGYNFCYNCGAANVAHYGHICNKLA